MKNQNKIEIYKFGGASLKTPDSLKNLEKIVKEKTNLIVVVSAIDKTTNKLEELIDAYFNASSKVSEILLKIKNFHLQYANSVFKDFHALKVFDELNILFDLLENKVVSSSSSDYDLEYDSIICYGELLSSCIVSNFLSSCNIKVKFVDIRQVLRTDYNHRDAKIDWQQSLDNVQQCFMPNDLVYVTQGFIASACDGSTTSLGREGSDYTASALAYLLDAESLTIWKDVPGIMNADPAWYKSAQKLDVLSYSEAIELAFFGAKVIHPKTIKPLENKKIPLHVKSFISPNEQGTVIKAINYRLKLIPIYILKTNQILISISPKDFSFIVEENMSKIFGLFAQYKIKVNITQNSAISFSASIDGDNRNFKNLVKELQKEFIVKYNTGLDLITIRFYDDAAIKSMTQDKKIYIEQRSRLTARFLMNNI